VSEIALNPPIDDSYVVPGTRLVAGEYPGSRPGTPVSESNARLARFLDGGITAFIDLTDPRDGLQPYDQSLKALAAERGIDLFYEQLTIRDLGSTHGTIVNNRLITESPLQIRLLALDDGVLLGAVGLGMADLDRIHPDKEDMFVRLGLRELGGGGLCRGV
jgi:hypothetical protein